MAYRFYGDSLPALIDAIRHPEVAAASTVRAFQFESERATDPMRALGQPAIDELDGCGSYLLWDSFQRSLGWPRPLDSVRFALHGLAISDEPERLVLGQRGGAAVGHVALSLPYLCQQLGLTEDFQCLLERLEIFQRHDHRCGTTVLGDDNAAVFPFKTVDHLR